MEDSGATDGRTAAPCGRARAALAQQPGGAQRHLVDLADGVQWADLPERLNNDRFTAAQAAALLASQEAFAERGNQDQLEEEANHCLTGRDPRYPVTQRQRTR